jgi:hypothetical protein
MEVTRAAGPARLLAGRETSAKFCLRSATAEKAVARAPFYIPMLHFYRVAPIRSVRIHRRQVQMLLHAPDARLELADDDAAADDRRVIFHDRATEADDLVARSCRAFFKSAWTLRMSEATTARKECISERVSALSSDISDLRSLTSLLVAISARMARNMLKTRLSGSPVMALL